MAVAQLIATSLLLLDLCTLLNISKPRSSMPIALHTGKSNGHYGRDRDDEGCRAETPMHCKRLRRFIGIEKPRHCATNTLERLVRANQNGCDCRVVRLGSHQPIAKGLPKSVIHAIEDVEKNRAHVCAISVEVNIVLQFVQQMPA